MMRFATAVGMVLVVAAVATAGSISPGDVIVVDRGNGTLDDVTRPRLLAPG